jgi:hypothetical protein
MSGDNTPGQTGSIRCPYCSGVISFLFTGGPHRLPCPHCRKVVLVEVVHDGIQWRTKIVRGGKE